MPKSLALIGAGYVLSVGGGLAAVAVNELFMPAVVAQTSPGMVAFGDVILFLLVTGFFGLAPTLFLLKLLVASVPRTLLAAEFLIAAMGPVSWFAMTTLAATPPTGADLSSSPQPAGELFGLFIAFGAVPRIVFGPVLMVVEGVTFLLVHAGIARALLVAAMLMDFIPLAVFALHLLRAMAA